MNPTENAMTGNRKTDDAAPEMKTVVIVADHVYLPLGPDGNVIAAWRDCPGPLNADGKFDRPDPVKVVKKTQLQAPADLAALLSRRDQAAIVR
jgi:hypothetical protein